MGINREIDDLESDKQLLLEKISKLKQESFI